MGFDKKAYQREYRAKNRETQREYSAAWWEAHRGEKLAAAKEARAAARALLPSPPPYVPPVEKACSHCGATKPLEAFVAHKQTRDKKNAWCRQCCNEANAVAKTIKRYTDPAWRAEAAEKRRGR